MLSITRQFQQRVAAGEVDGIVCSQAETSLVHRQQKECVINAAIAEDLKILKGIKGLEDKADYKRSLVIKYRERVETLQAQHDHRSIVLGYYLIWLFDAGYIPNATAFADYCIKYKVSTPETINRNVETFASDAVLAWSQEQFEADKSPEPYFSKYLEQIDSLNVPDKLKGKYWRLAGLLHEKADEIVQAYQAYKKAHEFGVKVKTRMEKLEKRLPPTQDIGNQTNGA